MRRYAERSCVLLFLCGAGASPVAAQRSRAEEARWDVAIGVTLNQPDDVNTRPRCTALNLPCTSPKTMADFGGSVQAVARATTHLSLVAEAGLYANRWIATGAQRSQSNYVSALLIGPRVETVFRFSEARGEEAWVRPFVQLLVGPERSTVLPTRMALQSGVGVDFPIAEGQRALRVEIDYRGTHGAGRNLSAHRVLIAEVLPIGGW